MLKANSNSVGVLLAASTRVDTGTGQLIAAFGITGNNRISVGAGSATTSAGTPTPYAYSRATIGSSDGSASGNAQDAFTGDISEILIYDRILTLSEEANVRAYLNAKYGL